MKNAITTLRIQNFKSVKDVEMQPRRVNIIIGEPNVGKSNILEAMSLLGGMRFDRKRLFMEGMVRYEQVDQLFYDNLVANAILVKSEHDACFIIPESYVSTKTHQPVDFSAAYMTANVWNEYFNGVASVNGPNRKVEPYQILEALIGGPNEDNKEVFLTSKDCIVVPFDKNGRRPYHVDGGYVGDGGFIGTSEAFSKAVVQPYFFSNQNLVNKQSGSNNLDAPSGDNLKSIIQLYPSLRQEIAKLLNRTGHKLSLRIGENKLEVIKDLDGIIYSYPYSSIADTLQRLIFYLAAIESNSDAVILLEEPEAHSFPVYVSQLGQRIVSSRNNQFFVATHSPYLITEILEEMLTNEELRPELAIFVAYYEDYQTKVRQLDEDEVRAIRADGLDVFYNMARFVPGPDTDF